MDKPKIFVIMPFGEVFFEVFNYLKQKFEDKYLFAHAADLGGQQSILKDIVRGINEAEIILADLSTLNANVFYELGLAHAMNKKVIIITQFLDELPFDLRPYRANSYDIRFSKINILVDKLSELLAGAVDGSIPFGNPVSDYLPEFFSLQRPHNAYGVVHRNVDSKNRDNEDKGFVDLICNLEEVLSEIDNIISVITKDFECFQEGVSDKVINFQSLSEIYTPSLGRKILRELAAIVNTCSLKLRPNNKQLEILCSRFENNFLSLMENKWIHTGNHKHELAKVLCPMNEMKQAFIMSRCGIKDFLESIYGIKNLESSLDQAISTINDELQLYDNIADNAVAIIDRIIEKLKLLVGDF